MSIHTAMIEENLDQIEGQPEPNSAGGTGGGAVLDVTPCCAFEVGDRVTVAGDFKKGEEGYIKELLAPKDDIGTQDDLWVVVIKQSNGCMSEEHFYSKNLRLGWRAKPNNKGYAGYGVAHHEHNSGVRSTTTPNK